MDPLIWGPPVWTWLTSMAFRCYDESNRQDVLCILTSLSECLPCPHCRVSYASYCERIVPTVVIDGNQDSALKWVWTIHDMVNQKLGKPCLAYSKLTRRLHALSNESTRSAIIRIVNSTKAILLRSIGPSSCWNAPQPVRTLQDAELYLFKVSNGILRRQGGTHERLEEFQGRFRQARIEVPTPQRKSKSSTRGR
jgi:hypothetical protein